MDAKTAISLIKQGKLPLQLYKDVATEEELRGSFAKLKAFADALPEGDEVMYGDSQKTAWDGFPDREANPMTERVVWDTPYTIIQTDIPPALLTFKGRHLILNPVKSDYASWERLGDYWVDDVRLQCSFNGRPSPMEYYSSHPEEVVRQCQQTYKEITPHNLRETIYNTKACKECSSFKSYLIVAMGKFLGARKVLDFCSGWGDRLIGAMAAGFEYVGVDPNTKLAPRYQEMIEFLYDNSAGNPADYPRPRMICAPIETADLGGDGGMPPSDFDMILTSPPYGDLEIYSDESTQSVKGKDNKEWLHRFLIPAVDKVVRVLKDGGYLVLVINQVKHGEYIEEMLKILDGYTFEEDKDESPLVVSSPDFPHGGKSKLYYYGVVSYGNVNPQPMWVWRKWSATEVPRNLYNPPAIYEKREHNGVRYQVVQDGYTVGGLKQRALSALWQKHPEKTTLVYGSPAEGAAQVAIAYTAKLLGKKGKLFVFGKNDKMGAITEFASAISGGALDVDARSSYTIKVAEEMADKYAAAHPEALRMTFGGGDAEYMAELEASLRESLVELIKHTAKINRIWITAGSATALAVLYRIFPNTRFMAVQVGKKVWPDQLNENTTLIVSDEHFTEEAKEQPPYDSVRTYDAKLWKYFAEQAQEGDVIYNVWRDTVALESEHRQHNPGHPRRDVGPGNPSRNPPTRQNNKPGHVMSGHNIMTAVKEQIDHYGKEYVMCYKSSAALLQRLGGAKSERIKDASSLSPELLSRVKNILREGGVIDMTLSISIEKAGADSKSDMAESIRKSLGITNTFFIPRLFLHAFNLFCHDGKLYVAYSWFRKMPYRFHHVGSCADGWLDDLARVANDFARDPIGLFELFGYNWRADYTVKQVCHFTKAAEVLYYGVDLRWVE